ncbi:protein LITTLE ZIPPER 1-like isoform X2 [Durio zibethinus]|uniref:Protein LITTLE ZIPPER 1-like isoform X2 n=1 Tax=Durio zibethinus TaxID=66656 RepID=A0A6P6AY30_DURZI|nr:protein LITTLE ZIPPER 1-like isoform X2 [Durio zibethinus]
MSINSSVSIPSNSFCRKRPSKRHNIRVRRLNRWRRSRKGAGTKMMIVCINKTDMQMKNLKLYMENQSIIEENEKLRKKALLLHQENQTLLAQLQKKLSNPQNHF